MFRLRKESQLRPLFGRAQLPLGLHGAVAADMLHRNAAPGQNPRDQQTAVANRRVLFTAQERQPTVTVHALLQPLKASLKEVRASHFPVQHLAIGVVKLFALRTPAQLLAGVDVPNSCGFQPVPQVVLIVLRGKGRVRVRAGIGHDLHVTLPEQIQEVFQGMVRVPDGQDGVAVHTFIIALK